MLGFRNGRPPPKKISVVLNRKEAEDITFITEFETLFQRVIHEMRVARKSIPQLKSCCERCCETSILSVSRCAKDSIHTSSIHAHDSSASTFAVGKLNHVAIAVPDVQAAATRYREVLGAHTSSPQPLPEHGVRVVFVTLEVMIREQELMHIGDFFLFNADSDVFYLPRC